MASTSPIHIKPSHVGLLRKEMGIPEGKKLTIGDLMKTKKKAKASGDVATEKRVVFAENARNWNKGNKTP